MLAVLVPAPITLMATDAAVARPDLQVRSLSATADRGTVRVNAAFRGASSTVAYHLSADVELDNTGCLSVTPFEGKLTDGLAVKANTDGDVSVLVEPPLEIKERLLKVGKVKITAKIAAKFCRRALW